MKASTDSRAAPARFARRTIAAKFSLLVAIAVIAAATAMSGILLWQELSRYAESKSRSLLGAAHLFATASARATAARDQAAAYQAIKAIAHIPEFRYARIDLLRGGPLAVIGGATVLDSDPKVSDGKASNIAPLALLSSRSIEASVPIIDGGLIVGKFTLVADTGDLADQLLLSLKGSALGAAIAMAFGLAIAWRLQRGVTRPLQDLTETIWRIRRNHNYRDRVTAASNDEVGLLIDGFNAMLGEIEARDASLAVHRRDLEREISDRTRDLIVAKDAAEAASAAKSDFLATMSHEIRTPMNGVLVMAELLAASDIPARQRRYAEVISKSGQSLLAIINDILDFSKIESGKLALEKVALEPAPLAEDVVSLFGEQAREKGVDLVAYVSPKTPRFISGDPVRLNQVIGNLVNNALKFTDSGSVKVIVAPHQTNAARIRFAISDTGVGVPADKLAEIFGSFTQADQSTTRRFGGTGLGLAISKRLIEAMGGDLQVKSAVGEGSTFFFSLPIGEHTLAEAWPHTVRAGQKAAIAVDGEATSEAVARYFSAAGFEVGIVRDRKAPIFADVVVADADRLEYVRRHDGDAVVCLTMFGDHAAHKMVSEGKADIALSRPLARSQCETLLRKITAGAPLRQVASAASEHDDAPRFDGLRVLVADDTAINREVAIETLSRLGAVVTTAENGLQAVAAVENQDFDIVLMDVSMPELDGFGATQRIRAAEAQGRRMPIVALTAHVVGRAADAWRAAGMDAVLYKPYTLRSLADCLAKFAPEAASVATAPAHSGQEDEAPAASPAVAVAAPDRDGRNRPAAENVIESKSVERSTAAKPVPGSSPLALDEETVHQLRLVAESGAVDFIARVCGLYLDNAPKAINDLRQAVQAGDIVAAGRVAHALKSMSLNMGARHVVAIAADIEARVHEGGDVTLDDVSLLAPALEEACAAVRQLLAGAAAKTKPEDARLSA